VDLAPGPKGRIGQLTVFGKHFFECRCVIVNSWTEFLDDCVSYLERGEGYTVDVHGYGDIDICMDTIYWNKVEELKEKYNVVLGYESQG
jgi:hypothetical protein